MGPGARDEERVRAHGLHLGRAIRLIWTSTPGWATVNLVLVVANGVLPLVGLYLLKRIVDALQAAAAVTGDGVT